MPELLVEAIAESRRDWTSTSFEEARTTLREWRDSSTRRSDETVELWEHVLSRRPQLLDDELWIVYEQVCIAALDCGRQDVANLCIEALLNKFGGSSLRIGKLRAMRFEAMYKYDEAMEIYDTLVETEPTNTTYRKRRVAVLIAQNKTEDAINMLNEYLQTFINDNEAWLQLSNLYLTQLDYARAAHCMEELVLAQPLNSHYAARYADIRYTQGGTDNVELAKHYYVHAAKANATNLRAHYGLLNACNWLAAKTTGQKRREIISLAKWAVDNISNRYQACPVETSTIAEAHVGTAVAILEAMQASGAIEK